MSVIKLDARVRARRIVTASAAARPARPRAPARAPSTTFRCGGCGERHDLVSWRALSLAGRVDAREVRRLVRDWPDDVCIEIRRCARCGHGVAGKTAASAP